MFVTTASCCKRRYTMNRKNIWMALFGTADLFRLNMGFLASMAAVTLTVVVMNVVFLGMKPRKKVTEEIKNA